MDSSIHLRFVFTVRPWPWINPANCDRSGTLHILATTCHITREVSREIIRRIAYPRDFPSRFVILANINTWRGLERSSLLAKDQRWSCVKSVRFIAMMNGDSLFATINTVTRIWCAFFSSLHVHQLFATSTWHAK